MAYNETPTKGTAMQHTYSFCGSQLHLVLEDDIAEGYNRFVDAFSAGQQEFKTVVGRNWTPSDPIYMDLQPGDRNAYNKVGRIINHLVEINGGVLAIKEEDCTTDHLDRI